MPINSLKLNKKIALIFGLTSLVLGTQTGYSLDLADSISGLESINKLRVAYDEVRNEASISKILVDNSLHSLSVAQRLKGPTEMETTKFQHYYKGIEVLGSMAFHHSNPSNRSIRNRIANFDLDANPTLSAESAIHLARSFAGDLELKSEPTLKILPSHSQGSAKLVYWVELKGKGWAGGRDLMIDAHTGQLIADLAHDYSLAQVQVYSAYKLGKKVVPNLVTNPITRKKELKNCKLIDLKKGTTQTISSSSCISIYNSDSSLSQSQCQVIDGMGGFPLDIQAKSCASVVSNGTANRSADAAANRAASNSKLVLDYYKSHLSRDSFDNKGTDLISVIHAGDKMSNAFWMTDLDTMVYGDGDGKELGDFTLAVDVAGHEMTHGVTTKTANLMMMGESGALNEAFSDYFGKLIENENSWTLGRELFIGANAPKGLRDLADPHSLTDTILDTTGLPVEKPYPAHKKEAAVVGSGQACDGSNDRCWVHYNSTIPGHASYLIHQSLGAQKAEVLLYTALTQNLTSTDDFRSTAQAVVQTCQQLNMSFSDCVLVKQAYRQVGLL